MNKLCVKTLVAAWTLAAAGTATAALPYGTLEFVERVGSAEPHEKLDVWMRLTLDASSSALTFSSDPLAGFDPADVPTEGQYFNPATDSYETRTFADVTGAYLNTFFGCDDTFTGGCNGNTTNYAYNFFLSSQPGKPSINFLNTFNLAPGASYEYVFAQFTPSVAGAQPGTYQFYRTGVTLNFTGVDIEGNYLTSTQNIATTCVRGNDDACAFTRVVAIPEPATYGLMALGLLAVGFVARRRMG